LITQSIFKQSELGNSKLDQSGKNSLNTSLCCREELQKIKEELDPERRASFNKVLTPPSEEDDGFCITKKKIKSRITPNNPQEHLKSEKHGKTKSISGDSKKN
jgi:hypothetical protein